MRTRVRALQLVLSIGILVWIYSRVPVSNVLETLRNASVPWVACATAFVLVLQVIIAVRWGLLVAEHGMRLPLRTVVALHLASAYYKLFIPGGMVAGIGVRFYKLQRLGGARPAMFSSVVVDRLLATAGLALVGTVAWLVDAAPAPAVVGWTMAAWTGVVGVLLAVATNARTARAMRALEARGRWRAISSRLVHLADAFGMYRSVPPPRLAALGLATLAPHVAGLFGFWALGRAVGVEIEPLSWAWLRAAISLVTTQPISVAGLGVREVVAVWLLAFFGIGQEDALAFASLLLGITVLLPALLGGVVEASGLLGPRGAPDG